MTEKKRPSPVLTGIAIGAAMLGTIVAIRELPDLIRYARIKRM